MAEDLGTTVTNFYGASIPIRVTPLSGDAFYAWARSRRHVPEKPTAHKTLRQARGKLCRVYCFVFSRLKRWITRRT